MRESFAEGRMATAPSYVSIVNAISNYRKSLTGVVTYGHVTVPLVYTQVITI